MALHFTMRFVILIITITTLLLPFHLSSSSPSSFTAQLIPRRFSSKPSSIAASSASTSIFAYLGHYLMKLSLGTPPVDIIGIADTGSDFVWTQCVPCPNCYKQKDPLFDPSHSSTYQTVPCKSDQCHVVDYTARDCPQGQNDCNFTYAYASASIIHGVLAKETLTFPSGASFDGFFFGCGHNDTGSFNDHESGIVGLGKGPFSLVTQLTTTFQLKKVFTHCLVPFQTDVSITSEITFGETKLSGGDGVVSTPLVTKGVGFDQTVYYVTLNGISVGPTYLPFNATSPSSVTKGNMFLDSGTPPTILPQSLYDRVAEEIKKQVTTMQPIVGDPDLGTQLCYKSEKNLDGPILKAHFDGADVELGPTQTFISPKDGVFCFGMTNNTAEVGIYGAFAQSNYLIQFDLDSQLLSFKATDCTKQQ